MLRTSLSQYSHQHGLGNIAPDQWQFDRGEYGKPRLCKVQFKQTGILFNLSHSGDYLLIGIMHSRFAYSDILLGVDIERERKNTNIHTIISRYFSASETADLLALPRQLQRQRFFDLWTLKESYIKATGKGLATRLSDFSFHLSDDSEAEAIHLSPEPIYQDRAWFLHLHRLHSDYRVAVSVSLSSIVSCRNTVTFP